MTDCNADERLALAEGILRALIASQLGGNWVNIDHGWFGIDTSIQITDAEQAYLNELGLDR